MAETASTRERVLDVAMRLFGENGYAGTTVAQIEAASGLSPGSGGLYRHFRSKRELLEVAVQAQVLGAERLRELLTVDRSLVELPLRERVAVVLRATMARLEQGRGLIRMLLRDYQAFPGVLARLREEQLSQVSIAVRDWLTAQPELARSDCDWAAVSGVMVASVSHYWFLRDSLDSEPFDVDEDRYLGAIADVVIRALVPASGG